MIPFFLHPTAESISELHQSQKKLRKLAKESFTWTKGSSFRSSRRCTWHVGPPSSKKKDKWWSLRVWWPFTKVKKLPHAGCPAGTFLWARNLPWELETIRPRNGRIGSFIHSFKIFIEHFLRARYYFGSWCIVAYKTRSLFSWVTSLRGRCEIN